MKKEDLVKLGLDETLATKVADASVEELKGFIPKARFDEVNDTNKQLKTDLTERNSQLEELKKTSGASEDLKKTIETLQASNTAKETEFNTKIKQIQIDNAVEKALLGAKAKNIKAVKALLDLETAELDGENVKGLEDQLKKLFETEDTKFLFDQTSGKPNFKGTKPGEGKDDGKGVTKNPWSKEHFNLTEQGKILTEDPELAQQLMKSK